MIFNYLQVKGNLFSLFQVMVKTKWTNENQENYCFTAPTG